jgi:hypothetical protein
VIVVDEYLALLRLAGQAPERVRSEMLALTYGRAYRLTRALLDPGPGRLAVRGRFSRLVEGLSPADQLVLHNRLSDADPSVLVIVDPRPTIRTAGAIQNTYAVSLLQAETLAAAVTNDWPILFGEPDSASDPFRAAATELGLDLQVLGR